MNTFASLRNTDYLYLWIGNLFNTAGLQIQQVTISWLVWELSGSATLVSVVSSLWFLPFLLIGPLGGVAADRMDRRRLLMITQTVMAAGESSALRSLKGGIHYVWVNNTMLGLATLTMAPFGKVIRKGAVFDCQGILYSVNKGVVQLTDMI